MSKSSPAGAVVSGALRRSVAIDVLRLVGITAVALGHLRANTPDTTGNLLRDVTFSWHVPLFFFLAGYLWRADRGIRDEVVTRARTVLLPFFSWTLVLLVPLLVIQTVQGNIDRTFVEVLHGGVQTQGIFAPFWFLPVLFLSTVLYRIMGRFLPEWASVLVVVASIAACSVWGSTLASVPHDVLFAVPMVLFLIAGRAVRRYEGAVKFRGWWGLLLLLGGLFLAASGTARPLDVKLGDFGTAGLSVVNAVVICTGLLWVAQAVFPMSKSRPWHAVVSALAQTILVVLLTHVLFFQACGLVHLPAPLTLPISLSLGFGLGVMLRRTPLSPWLVGAPQLRDRPSGIVR